MSGQHHHRASLKQSNKKFKSKHSSKGSIKDATKGRVPTAKTRSGGGGGAAGLAAAHNKAARKNTAKQLQLQKRQAVKEKKKLTSGNEAKAPRVVAVVQLCSDVGNERVVKELLDGSDLSENVKTINGGAIYQVDLPNPRATLQFLTPSYGDLMGTLDACATADFVLLSLSGGEEVQPWGETCLRSLASLGVGDGAVRSVVSNLPENAAAATQVRKSLHSFLKHFFPSLDRVHSPTVPSEAANLLRSIGDRLPKGVSWRETRARLLVEEAEWQANATQEQGSEGPVGTLAITGVIRGGTLSANRLVHLQGFGDYAIEKIVGASQGPSQPRKRQGPNDMEAETPENLPLSEPTPSEADDLVSTNVPSEGEELMNEQTWPTEDEIAGAPANLHRTFGTEVSMPPPALPGTTPRRLKRVPKGTSAYQAAWIVDDDDNDEEYESDEEDRDMMEEALDEEGTTELPEEVLAAEAAEEYEDIDPSGSERQYSNSITTGGVTGTHHDLPMDIENAQYQEYLQEKLADRERKKESKDDLEFPDEVDTPLDIPARERFARYRGLKSFRTSAWDPYENLPRDYSRVFMFTDYRIMGKKLAARAAEDGVESGTRVIIYLKNVPQAAAAYHSPAHPLILYGLLKHEHKTSVLNFTCTRNTEYLPDIRSKDPLVVQVGPRRYNINPLWSQHTSGNNGKGTNNVHKFEKYLRHGPNASVGTAYLPITFGINVPTIVFQARSSAQGVDELPEGTSDSFELVGTGSLLGVDPTRIIAKRIVLTGHPYKVHKKTATIRYMFFNQPDVEYYKPVELRTKKGRIGHIRESLGTHGYFKAGFDGPIDQMDTICLNLYKRCFPKWSTSWKVAEQNLVVEAPMTNGHANGVAVDDEEMA